MKKVAIVGVEGSGKTVLMAAMGDKYKTPDANGFFLMPLNRETFAYYTRESDRMRNGAWPMATSLETCFTLDWALMLKKSERAAPEQICEIEFADFPGEIYRAAFGGGEDDDKVLTEEFEKNVFKVKNHVADSDVLIVLVNLADVINARHSDERTIEMLWLTQAMLGRIEKKEKRRHIALVFTQVDSYAETIRFCGGLKGVLEKYLPQVHVGYADRFSLFAVSAVNKTIPAPDGSGCLVPAEDFSPEGFEPLVKWIANQAARIKDRPARKMEKPLEKRSLIRWLGYCIGRFGLLAFFGMSCAGGALVGWHAVYPECAKYFGEFIRAKYCAAETLNALYRQNFPKFKTLTRIPEGAENRLGVDRESFAKRFAEKRGQFWDQCKGIAQGHGYRPRIEEIKPCFTCNLFGSSTYVFSFDGYDSSSYYYSDRSKITVGFCTRNDRESAVNHWFCFDKSKERH